MSYDIPESVSQRGSGEETAENRRIHEIADELHRRCQLYEAQLRDGQGDVNYLWLVTISTRAWISELFSLTWGLS